jgi:hypothetical protein
MPATNAQKLPLQRSLSDIARVRAGNRVATTGKTYPCSVTAVHGSIVTVKFEINQPPFTLPPATMPVFGPEYIRYPIQVGCKGMAIAADAFIGAMSGLGTGVADLSEQPNLSALMFMPVGNVDFSPVDGQAIVLYGPNGCVLKAMSGLANITLTPNQITLSVGSVSIVIDGSNVTIQGKPFLPHTHGGVVTGGANTTGVT